MPWPLASHFSAMLQNPAIAFRDPELKRCSVEKDGRNQPRPWAGAFAVVYKGIHPDGSPFAVRVFVTESPERRERYDHISAYLRERPLRCLVPFEYRDRSIRSASDGKWYPLILMDWVEGETLYEWTRASSLRGDRDALASASQHWLALVKELEDAHVAHGDLQHANVMVTPEGQLKLVDYDCMCVPALVGRRNLEVGVEPYQHPQRDATTLLCPELDRFSALVIYVALRALAADPSLWHRHVEGPAHDKLLFRTEDFAAGADTPIRRDLAASPDPEVADLARQLFEAAARPMDQVLPLGALANSFAKVEALLRAEEWDAAVELLNRRGQFSDAPEALKPLIRHAYEHVFRKQAWEAVQRVPEGHGERADRALIEAWNEPLLAGYGPAEELRPRLEAARHHVAILDRLRHLIQESSRQIVLAEERMMVELADQLPPYYQHSLGPRIERARQRVECLDALTAAVRDSGEDDTILRAWRRAQRKMCQDLVPAAFHASIGRAEQRRMIVESLKQIPPDLPADQMDRRVLEVWNEELLDGCADAQPWAEAYRAAVARREALARLQRAVESGDEAAIAQAAGDPLLADYPLPAAWASILKATSEKLSRIEGLVGAIAQGDRAEFLRRFDARLIRENLAQFLAHRQRLESWVRGDVLRLETLGLSPALARAGVAGVDAGERTFRLRWTWPEPRFTDRCTLAVVRAEPLGDEGPEDVECLFRGTVDRGTWETSGGSRLLRAEPEWTDAFAVVWAELDLGFGVLHSPPLVLGRLAAAGPRTRGFWSRLGGARRPAPRAAASTPSEPDPARPAQSESS